MARLLRTSFVAIYRDRVPSEPSQLEVAITNGDGEALAHAIEADPASARAQTTAGVSPLLLACYHRRADLAAVIIPHAGDLDVFEAAAVGDPTRLTALLDADPDVRDAVAADGFLPLGLAAFLGHADAVTFLLSRGADVRRSADNPSSVQAIHAAVAARRPAIVRTLLEHGADPDAVQQGGVTPLLAAAMHGDDEIVDLLLAFGADPDRAADDGRTPAELAAGANHSELAERLRPSQ